MNEFQLRIKFQNQTLEPELRIRIWNQNLESEFEDLDMSAYIKNPQR